MITAVSNKGDVYVSLSQSNTNQNIMSLFMEQLVLKLDKENPRWRANTILTWDGAPYHRSKESKKMLERLDIPMMMMGPYSYDAAPCELFFAAFKADDVNPNKVPLGKGNFELIINLVVQRCL